jgi:hypothetical protein
MFFRRLATKEATLSYLFGCGSCHVAVAVDPVLGDEDWFLTEAAEQNVKITHVIDTHVHADHYSGGRSLAEKAGAPYDSLQQRVVALPGEVELYPGHTSGSVCGAGISGKPGSTLAFEKRWNPLLSLERGAFVEALTKDIPPRPAETERWVAANRGR